MMAQKMSGETIAQDMSPPNYRAAFKRLECIKAKKDKIASVNGEIADIFAKVEGHKVHKKAARIFLVLKNLEDEERQKVYRDLNGLLDAAGFEDESQDLVDAAQGNVVHHRFGQSNTASSNDGGDADDDGSDDELDALEQEAEPAGESPMDAARRHLGHDDADLAGDDDELGEAAE